MRALELEHVSKGYGERAVLCEVSLRVEPGERLVLFGPSGYGKTTLLRLVAGFAAPDRGVIRLGETVASSDGKIIVPPERRHLGMVFQDLALWPHLTVRGNLAFGLKAQGASARERHRRIQETLAMVEIEEYAGARATELSGGEQQRVALARALVLRPDILLMDEPLSSLDEALSQRLLGVILHLHQELGFTLLYVTHSREEAEHIGSRVVYLREGKLQP
ncbi:MAG TPA: ABC transporter ATP-binding protein [Chloroflexota bacterium]|nr:ABC transporter ATP-binding protein [Chloroflexota bacterium]